MRSVSRLEQLRAFALQNPTDPFPQYGVAMEYKNLGRLAEADRAFRELIERFPDYTAAYFHAGGVLAALGRQAEARAVYQTGIVVCERKGAGHAKGELLAALADLGSAPDPGGGGETKNPDYPCGDSK